MIINPADAKNSNLAADRVGNDTHSAIAAHLPSDIHEMRQPALPPINLWNYYTLWHNAEHISGNGIESIVNIAE